MGEQEQCVNCRFSVCVDGGLECHKQSPTPFGVAPSRHRLADPEQHAYWPSVLDEEWCGEYERIKPRAQSTQRCITRLAFLANPADALESAKAAPLLVVGEDGERRMVITCPDGSE